MEKSIGADATLTPEEAVTALDWTGPNDPENPENWSAGKKAFHIAYVGLQCFVVCVGLHVYLPTAANNLAAPSPPRSTHQRYQALLINSM